MSGATPPPRASSTSHGVQYGPCIGFARAIDGLPLVAGQRHTRITLRDVDAALLGEIQRLNGHGHLVMIVTIDGSEYTLSDCEAIAISPTQASVLLAVGEVTLARPSDPQ